MVDVEQFDQYRPLLFSIAYRMLGSVMEAEDMVQETFLRWRNGAESEIKSMKAYLTTIITRLCIDHLRSARVQRENYIGPWLPEPLVTEKAPDAADMAILADSLSMAFLVLLESLTPVERAVFLLREVFDYDYTEIARIVGKSEANCRQMARRARQHITDRRPRFEPSAEMQQQLTIHFMEACASGDLPGLVNLLADDITIWSDGGGKVAAAMNPIHGADKVARFYLGLVKKAPPNMATRLAWINHQPGLISYVDGQPVVVITLDIAEGSIQAIRNVVNPDKLKNIPPASTD